MRPTVHDALAVCRYQSDRCARTVQSTQALREELSHRLTIMVLQLAKNVRIRRKLNEGREKLSQQRRILAYGPTAKFVI